jgi:hypothetical protein
MLLICTCLGADLTSQMSIENFNIKENDKNARKQIRNTECL